MPSKYTVNVSLTEHLSGFVAAQVASGRFYTASEVVRAALRLLERDLKGAEAVQADGRGAVHVEAELAAPRARRRSMRTPTADPS